MSRAIDHAGPGGRNAAPRDGYFSDAVRSTTRGTTHVVQS